MANRVTLYTGIGNSTPQQANPLIHQPVGKFVLRYLFRGKRRWETLEAMNYTEALVTAKQREIELMGVDPEWEAQVQRLKEAVANAGEVEYLTRQAAPVVVAPPPRPLPPTVQAYKLMRLDAKAYPKVELATAIDAYNQRCATRSGKTVGAYTYTLTQFFTSCRWTARAGRAGRCFTKSMRKRSRTLSYSSGERTQRTGRFTID